MNKYFISFLSAALTLIVLVGCSKPTLGIRTHKGALARLYQREVTEAREGVDGNPTGGCECPRTEDQETINGVNIAYYKDTDELFRKVRFAEEEPIQEMSAGPYIGCNRERRLVYRFHRFGELNRGSVTGIGSVEWVCKWENNATSWKPFKAEYKYRKYADVNGEETTTESLYKYEYTYWNGANMTLTHAFYEEGSGSRETKEARGTTFEYESFYKRDDPETLKGGNSEKNVSRITFEGVEEEFTSSYRCNFSTPMYAESGHMFESSFDLQGFGRYTMGGASYCKSDYDLCVRDYRPSWSYRYATGEATIESDYEATPDYYGPLTSNYKVVEAERIAQSCGPMGN